MRATAVLGSTRQLGTVAVVAGISGAYAGFLVMVSAVLGANSDANGGGIGAILAVVATAFILVAVYVSSVVTVNCLDTVLAGMAPRIALLRLLGASATSLRAAVTRRTTVLAAGAAALGTAVGAAGAVVLRVVLVHHGVLESSVDYPVVSGWLVPPVLTTTAAAYLAARYGARGVLRVSPVSALQRSTSAYDDVPPKRRARGSLVVIAVGLGLLVAAMALGEAGGTPMGFLVACAGAACTGTGLLVGARLVVPATVAGLGRVLGRSAPSVIARRNAVKNPLRTARTTSGLVVGVALVTTFAAGMDALQRSVAAWESNPVQRKQTTEVLTTTTAVLVTVIVVSALIAGVGFVSTMSLTVIERHREIGLLRALGFTRTQVRSMVIRESAALAVSAVALGVGIGLCLGTAGAQSLIGFKTPGLVWGRPWPVLATIAIATAALVVASSTVPARSAVKASPTQALRSW